MATKVTVITPVWNHSFYTAGHLLQMYQNYRDRQDVEFIVVDNGSIDNTPSLLASYISKMDNLRIVTNKQNEGFPVACNQGAREAIGDILLFLNNDTMIFGDYITHLKHAVNDRVVVGPELNKHNTGWNQFGDSIIPYVAGWCLALTKASYEQLGGFDERYTPCDYEDMDLCYHATKEGYELLKVDLPIRHISGGSAMPDRLAITERNRGKFREKWGL
jgi:O-antigen biosynthesis protein